MRWEEEPWEQGKAGRVSKRGARRLHSNIPWAGDLGLGQAGKDWLWTNGRDARGFSPLRLVPRMVG